LYYADSSILISYLFTSEVNHRVSRRILEDIAIGKKTKIYVSSLTLLEVYNALCRKIVKEKEWRLIEPIQWYVNGYKSSEDKCRELSAIAINILKERLGIEFVDHEELYEFVESNFNKYIIPRIFKDALMLSPKLNIRVKDLLHLVYAHSLSDKYKIEFFLTCDIEDFGKIKDIVKNMLKINIEIVKA